MFLLNNIALKTETLQFETESDADLCTVLPMEKRQINEAVATMSYRRQLGRRHSCIRHSRGAQLDMRDDESKNMWQESRPMAV